MNDQKEDTNISCGMVEYKGVCTTLKEGIISFAARDDESIEIVRPLADALNAVIQGDEGEFY